MEGPYTNCKVFVQNVILSRCTCDRRTPEWEHTPNREVLTALPSVATSVYQICATMRNAAVVILWFVAAASLFLSPAKAETELKEIPPLPEPPLVNVESDPDNSTTLHIVPDQFSGSDVDSETDVDYDPDVVPESDVVLHSKDEEEGEEEDYYVDQEEEGEDSLLDERFIGNVRNQRSDRQKEKVDNSQNPKWHKKIKGVLVDAGAKRHKGQRRGPEDVKLNSRKKHKGEKTKPGRKVIRKKKITAQQVERIVESSLAGERDASPSVKNEESSRRKKSKRRKREA